MKRRLLPYAFTLIFPLLQSGCENTLPEFRRFEIVENASRVLVLDRHGLYFDETKPSLQQGVSIVPLFPKPMHQPPASQPMPRWLQDFDEAVYLYLRRGIRERQETDWNYELVFPLSPLPPVYASPPYQQVDHWPEPMAPEEIIAHAEEHDAQAVVVLDYIILTIMDTTLQQDPPQVGSDRLPSPLPDRAMHVNMTGGFRSYDGKTGEVVDAQKFSFPHRIPWKSGSKPLAPATIEWMKTGMAGEALEEVIKLADQALMARDVHVQ